MTVDREHTEIFDQSWKMWAEGTSINANDTKPKEQELIEDVQQEEYLHKLRWEENMNQLYTWDDGGFCDGFTNQ